MTRRQGNNYSGARWTYRRRESTADADRIRALYAASGTEDDLLTAILDAARLLKWRIYHVRRSDLAIVQGDVGFPDVVLARNGFVLFLEIKSDGGSPTEGQLRWMDALGGADLDAGRRHIAAIVYPRDLDRVLAFLK